MRPPRFPFLAALALVAVISLGCDPQQCSPCRPGYSSKTHCGTCVRDPDAAVDGPSSTGDGAACQGEPISCVEGGLSGTGVACNSNFRSATCVGGQWTCPKGTVAERDCTCGEPGLNCANQTCTPQGPVCLDAGVDAPADAPADGPSCSDASFTYCWQGGQVGDVTICSDFGAPATCVDGRWTCPPGSLDGGVCNCSGPHPPGCGVCTKTGWQCPDGGADADAASDASSAS